ncbi:retinol dehydrogenase 3-like [Limulus polyphemus]|uniref:Retinol dehydrogenase 3-like n=1 Tax=Limulus polyphemus TaxID=6850 RepID=A0ABM1T4C3_LIMPO|nr:retinol dehydrogenase 3-like [Limulus polyphemus]
MEIEQRGDLSSLKNPGLSSIEDESFMMYSLLYSCVSVLFGISVLLKFLNSELRLGFRSVLSLVILFVGEPLCQFAIQGHMGFAGFACGCLILYATLPASHLDAKDKTVLITGCDSGFGHALAKHFDQLGMRVYATCHHGNSAGSHILQSTCSSRLKIYEMDVTNEKQVDKVAEMIECDVGNDGLWSLVNNAGIWYCSEADMMSMLLFREVVEVNQLGTIYVTKAFLPLLKLSQGRLIFISSVVGRMPLPHFAAYSIAKAAVEAFADVLRHEMKKWKVSVSVIEPNCFYTEAIVRRAEVFQKVWDHMDHTKREQYGQKYFDAIVQKYDSLAVTFPQDLSPVIRCVKSALLSRKPRPRYITDRGAEFLMWLHSVLPTWLGDKLVDTVDVVTPKSIRPKTLMRSAV